MDAKAKVNPRRPEEGFRYVKASNGRSDEEVAWRMSELPLALGDGWLGRAISYVCTAGLAAVGALWARKADVGRMIDQRWTGLSEAQEKRISKAEARCDAAEEAHAKCEASLSDVREEIAELMRRPIAPYPAFNPPVTP